MICNWRTLENQKAVPAYLLGAINQNKAEIAIPQPASKGNSVAQLRLIIFKV
jgi:hypothetical protein